MRDGLKIFDVDRHVYEPLDLWAEYLPEKYRKLAPYLEYIDRGESLSERMTSEGPEGSVPLPPDLMVDGRPVMNISRSAKRVISMAALERPGDVERGETAAGQIEAMDETGIDAALILPSYGSYFVAMQHGEPGLAAAYAEAYNRWLADMCAENPKRMVGAAMIARYDSDAMLDQARFAVERGWPAVVVRPNPIAGKVLGHDGERAFWDYCTDNGLVVAVHEAAHAMTTTAGADRFSSRFAQHACSHPLEQMMAFLSLLECGVLERHPDLRVAFLEAGCGWMVNWLWRLDSVEYGNVASEVASTIRKPPSEYFRAQCRIGVEPDEPLMNETVSFLGEDKLMFGSDFPHLDHDDDIVGEAMRMPVSRERLKRILWDNAAEMLGLE